MVCQLKFKETFQVPSESSIKSAENFKMHKREFLKKKIASTNDHTIWEQYKEARNEVNNSIKRAKLKYFTDNLDANKKDGKPGN